MIDTTKLQPAIVSHFKNLASDENFNSERLIETTLANYSIKHLSYSTRESFKHEDEEAFTMDNAPNGIPFVPGKKIPYIDFCFAVSGNDLHLSNMGNSTEFRTNGIGYNPNNNQKYFVFRRYSDVPFIGNDALLEQINNEAKLKKEFIESSINNFNKEADEANAELRKFIESEFLKEKEKRTLKKAAMDKLNPF